MFLLTQPGARAWLRRPQPYVAGLVALAVFAPVLVWNAQHGWVSFLFQGGRVGAGHLNLLAPLVTLAGEALFVLPWIWVLMVGCVVAAWRGGPAVPASWLLLCLALPAIAVFEVLSLRTHILFHWAAAGYVMLFPLLGQAVAARRRISAPVRTWLRVTAWVVPVLVAAVALDVRYDLFFSGATARAWGLDPFMDAQDWRFLPDALAARGLSPRPGLVLAGLRWHDAGKIDYATGGRYPVICLGADPREYGLISPVGAQAGADVVIIGPRLSLDNLRFYFGGQFARIVALPPAMLRHGARDSVAMPMFLARGFRP